jgi:BON domain
VFIIKRSLLQVARHNEKRFIRGPTTFRVVCVSAFKRHENLKAWLVMGNKHKIFIMALCLGILAATATVAFMHCAANQNANKSGQSIDDKALQRQVRVALENNPGYEFSEVKVDVHSGAVQLSGLVDTSYQKSKASEVANNVLGVTTVKNIIILTRRKRNE